MFLKGVPMRSLVLFVLLTAMAVAQTESDSVGKSSSLLLPDSLSFCGENIPLDVADVRERFEEVLNGRLVAGDRLAIQLKRTRRFFPLFERILKEMGLPDDLKYLSVAESSLKVEAYSHADAAGLWQFIPSTGKLWGLRVDKLIDERFHAEKSTRAACRLLKNLREAYGSWCLAAAAYNTGQGNLNRVIQHQQQRDYFDLFLNKETRYYIFHIVALKEILEHPTKYGIYLHEDEYYPAYDHDMQTIALRGPVMDIVRWGKTMGLSYKQIKLNNFWIMKYSLPEGAWDLLVPATVPIDSVPIDSSGTTDLLLPEDATGTAEIELLTFYHKVLPSETLSGIAQLYDVATSDLRMWNSIRGDLLYSGSSLKITVPQGHQIQHAVQPGENLTVIARRYSTSVERLIHWNNLTSDIISPGTRITVFVGIL